MLLFLLQFTGCSKYLAEKVVKAPNFGKTADELGELSEEQMAYRQFDSQGRITIGSPEISMHYVVIEPRNEWAAAKGTAIHDKLSMEFDLHNSGIPSQEWAEIPEIMYLDQYPDKGDFNNMGLKFTAERQTPPRSGPRFKGTVVFLHGLGVDKMFYASSWAQLMASHGYRCILPDLRGHGRTTGDYVTYGRREAEDVSRLLDRLWGPLPVERPVILFGTSLGGSTAIQTAAKDSRVDAVIALEPFSSLLETAYDFARLEHPVISMFTSRKIIEKAVEDGGKIAGFDARRDTALDAAGGLETPLLVIHGSDDRHVTAEHSFRLHEAAANSTLIIKEGKHHMNLGCNDIYDLRDKIFDWLEKSLYNHFPR
ncbi:alpha/beta hydrolase family protein [Limihaloglobus sulfuriphilus]|nr:alpha/beta hydrolase [Limihaloglobus sulfuriphilus]